MTYLRRKINYSGQADPIQTVRGMGYRLEVEPGLALADRLPHVWERFYQVDPGRSESEEGSGLGLSIAQAQGGSIRLDSRIGVGTWVTISLPGAPDPARSANIVKQ